MSYKFYINSGPRTIAEIAKIIDAEIIGNKDHIIYDIKTLDEANSNHISFLENKKYLSNFMKTNAGACIVSNKHQEQPHSNNITLLKVENAYFAYAKILELFYSPSHPSSNIAKSSVISETAKIGNNCIIGHNVVIEHDVELGDNSIIGAGTYIGHGVKIGNNARIDTNVTISNTIIGNDVVILPGAKIGQDGFGFATHKGMHKKILHIGRVIIGDDVEIGANSCIDRGSMKDTVIEDYCRIDNLVQIGHNVHIGQGSIIVSQVGIAGSSTIGKYCALGGQVGISGHIKIADQVYLTGQAGVMNSINEPGAYGGSPAVSVMDWHKQTIILKKLIKNKTNAN